MTDEKWSFLVSRLVHELRTPLGSVLMLTELLGEGLDAKGGEQTRKIRKATTDVLGLLAEVSELAKIEGGRLDVTTSWSWPRSSKTSSGPWPKRRD